MIALIGDNRERLKNKIMNLKEEHVLKLETAKENFEDRLLNEDERYKAIQKEMHDDENKIKK